MSKNSQKPIDREINNSSVLIGSDSRLHIHIATPGTKKFSTAGGIIVREGVDERRQAREATGDAELFVVFRLDILICSWDNSGAGSNGWPGVRAGEGRRGGRHDAKQRTVSA